MNEKKSMESTIKVTSPTEPFPAYANHTPRTEAAPDRSVLLPYPEWPAVVDSLLDVFARLHAAGCPNSGASGPIASADSRPPDSAALMDVEAFLACIAGCELPAGPRVTHSLNGLLEAVMALHLRVLLQHNRRVRLDGMAQGSEGGKV